MTVKQYLIEKMKKGTIHLALLDPDKQDSTEAAEIALKIKEAGTDAIMIGGSTGVTSNNLGATAKAIKESSGLPTIHFPGGPPASLPTIWAPPQKRSKNRPDFQQYISLADQMNFPKKSIQYFS
jgi:Predicted phosphate-binding enzymes, TIM-barrel fold